MKRKLIEQVIGKATMIATISAAATTAHTSSSIDREGYLSAHVIGQSKASAGDTATITFHVYDSSDNSTFAIHDSANATVTLAISAAVTASTFDVDLAGAKRYVKVYATPTAAISVTATITAALILGDGQIEPAS